MAISVLSLITVATFGYTCSLRRPWFGRLSEDLAGHQWLTASSVKFCRNWYREGAWTLRFALLENPASVEFATLASRSPYVSYPPGSVVPLFCLAQLVRQEPTPALVMGYNLANQLLIALLLSFLSYRLLTHIGLPALDATLLSLPPPLVYLWTPACFYFHQSVFFADTAILLPFVLLLFLEALQFNRMSRTLSICQWLVFCYAYRNRSRGGEQ